MHKKVRRDYAANVGPYQRSEHIAITGAVNFVDLEDENIDDVGDEGREEDDESAPDLEIEEEEEIVAGVERERQAS